MYCVALPAAEIKEKRPRKKSENIWKIDHSLHCVQSKQTEHIIIRLIDQGKSNGTY